MVGIEITSQGSLQTRQSCSNQKLSKRVQQRAKANMPWQREQWELSVTFYIAFQSLLYVKFSLF